jgi:hypothetical protein
VANTLTTTPAARAPLTMSAVMQDRNGTTAVLTRREIARSNISDTPALIRVQAAGVSMREMLSPSDVQMDR